NYFLQVYVATSTDGGNTFINHRVTTDATDPMVGRQEISLSVADYIGIAAAPGIFYPVWTDGRTNDGDLNIYTSRVPARASSSVDCKSGDQSRFAMDIRS